MCAIYSTGFMGECVRAAGSMVFGGWGWGRGVEIKESAEAVYVV